MFALSICTILKNEEAQVARITSEWSHDQIENVYVDTGSTDKTLAEFSKIGVSPYFFKWCDDFSAARNFSISKASTPWILWLDADDHIEKSTFEELLKVLPKLSVKKAYRFIIKNPTDEGEGQVFRQVRLFPNFQGVNFKGKVHEELASSLQEKKLSLEDLNLTIEHRGYYDAKARQNKTIRNQKILQKQIQEDPNDAFAFMELGNCFYQQKEYSKASEYYLHALNKRVLNGSALDGLEMLLGQNFLKQGMQNEAKKWFQKSIENSPHYLGAHFELAKIALAENDFILAEKYFKNLLEQPYEIHSLAESVESLRQNSAGYLALILFGSKRHKEALVFLEKAYSKERGLSVDWALPFELCYELQEIDLAKKWVNRLGQVPDDFKNKVWWKWFLNASSQSSEESCEGSRMDQDRLIQQLALTPTNNELWKNLKSLSKKFDNWDRSLARLALLRQQSLGELEAFYNEDFYAQLNPSRNPTKTR